MENTFCLIQKALFILEKIFVIFFLSFADSPDSKGETKLEYDIMNICGALRDLVPCAQFKKLEKLAGFSLQLY